MTSTATPSRWSTATAGTRMRPAAPSALSPSGPCPRPSTTPPRRSRRWTGSRGRAPAADGRPLGPTLLLDDAGHPGSRPPAAMGGHRLPHRRNLPAQGPAPRPQIVRGGSTPCRPTARGRARGPAGIVVVRQEALGRLSAAALSDPLLRRVAPGSDQQGPGGPNARGTGEERPS